MKRSATSGSWLVAVSDMGILSGSGKVGAAGGASRGAGAGAIGAGGAGRTGGAGSAGRNRRPFDVVCIYCTATQNELNLPVQTFEQSYLKKNFCNFLLSF